MREKFKILLKELDDWLNDENFRLFKETGEHLKQIEMKIMGQFALLISLPDEELGATADLDATIRGDPRVKESLKSRLLDHNLVLDDDAELIQMPKGTEWPLFYKGKFISAFVAAPEFVVASKCQFKRIKDKTQLQRLLKKFPQWRTLVKSLKISTEWLNEK